MCLFFKKGDEKGIKNQFLIFSNTPSRACSEVFSLNSAKSEYQHVLKICFYLTLGGQTINIIWGAPIPPGLILDALTSIKQPSQLEFSIEPY